MVRARIVFSVLALAAAASAQESFRLKTWRSGRAAGGETAVAAHRRVPGRSHMMLEFPHRITAGDRARLREQGIAIVSAISDRAVTAAVPDGVDVSTLGLSWAGRRGYADKISPAIFDHGTVVARADYVVEFHRDVDPIDARAVASQAGLTIVDRPEMLSNHLLVRGSLDELVTAAGWDEVAYIFPASAALASGAPVTGCAGAITQNGPLGQSIPKIGDGWDGAGLGAAALGVSFTSVTEKASADAAQAEILRALNEWAKYAALSFSPGAPSTANSAINVLFARGAHGDPYPFDGPGGVLAHTFYPGDVNPEPIAGDMHFDADESWNIGADVDIFSVALHEAGHALGLGHSDQPGAVMYPYYHQVTGLAAEDIAAIRDLYAAASGGNTPQPAPNTPAQTPPVTPTPDPPQTPPAPAPNPPQTPQTPPPTPPQTPAQPAPMHLAVSAAPASTSEGSATIAGVVSGGSAPFQVRWINGAVAGTAQGSGAWLASVPLQPGWNNVIFTAIDAQQVSVSVSIAIDRISTPQSLVISTPVSGYFSVTTSTITITGTAADPSGIDHITWSSTSGGSGTAAGITAWSAGPIKLQNGPNVITITAWPVSGKPISRSVLVLDAVAQGRANPAPALSITSPTSSTIGATKPSITIAGTARAGSGIASVTWTNSNGGSGTAQGTTSWNTGPIPLLEGSSLITIRATDTAGAVAWRTVSVTRK